MDENIIVDSCFSLASYVQSRTNNRTFLLFSHIGFRLIVVDRTVGFNQMCLRVGFSDNKKLLRRSYLGCQDHGSFGCIAVAALHCWGRRRASTFSRSGVSIVRIPGSVQERQFRGVCKKDTPLDVIRLRVADALKVPVFLLLCRVIRPIR